MLIKLINNCLPLSLSHSCTNTHATHPPSPPLSPFFSSVFRLCNNITPKYKLMEMAFILIYYSTSRYSMFRVFVLLLLLLLLLLLSLLFLLLQDDKSITSASNPFAGARKGLYTSLRIYLCALSPSAFLINSILYVYINTYK